MHRRLSTLSARSRLIYATVCIALGCYPLALATGILSVDESRVLAPMWVVALAGLVFVIAGLMILLANNSRTNDLLAGVMLFVFSLIGAWVALFGTGEGFSGGLPVLSRDANVALGHWVFGGGACISFAMSVYAFRRAATSALSDEP